MNMSQYLEMFLVEAKEHLQNLNDKVLALENNPDDKAIIDEIFRSAHTLKGMSATMGFDKVAELTHQMENVLHKVRAGERQVSSPLVDIFFKCLDTLDILISNIGDGGEGNLETSSLVTALQAAQEGHDRPLEATGISEGSKIDTGIPPEPVMSIEFNEYEKNIIRQSSEQGFFPWHLTVEIRPTCVMKSARAFMVFKNLEALGEVIKTNPSIEDIEDERFDPGFEIVLITKSLREEIIKAVNSIAEVDLPGIFSINIDNPPIPQEVKEKAKPANPQPAKTSPKEGVGGVAKHVPTIRVDIERLDLLINLVGELVINKTRLARIGHNKRLPDLNETIEQMDRISLDLQNLVMKVRMVPIEQVFNRFPRMVRDLARDMGKEVELIIEGKETELDRTVIDEIGDPLVHLLRNCLDHGVETKEQREVQGKPAQAKVRLAAKHEGNSVVIEVEDDGKGINTEVLMQKALEKGVITSAQAEAMEQEEVVNLIFAPGLSTAEKVTDISGRGVGLDAVRSKIESLSGSIFIETEKDRGTKFKINLPLTLAIIRALLVQVNQEAYAIPLGFIDETTIITPQDIRNVHEQEVILLRGNVLPLVRLHKPVGLSVPDYQPGQELFVVVVRKNNRQVGLVVDELIGQQEIVIKNLGHLLGGIPGLAGATILGDGRVSLILDITTLF
ncbi:MAG: chemotaxis protein CheA [Clostridia bacterium]|nr:chemotaxis protein CheA [Clostridia bacterium]